MNDSPVIIGEITGVFGVKGWVKVFSHTEPRDNIVKYNPWLVQQGGTWKSLRVLEGKPQGKTIVAQIEGVNDRDAALVLTGAKIGIEASQLKKLDGDDFYWRDLEGLEVYDLQGKHLGRVSHLIETGANDVLVLKTPAQPGKKTGEMMIPYLYESVVKKVDLDAGRIDVDWDDDYL